jgi:hypothetical protein
MELAQQWHLTSKQKQIFMSLKKRKSKVLEEAQKRLAGLESIDLNLDLGNGLSVATYKTDIQSGIDKLDELNQAKSKHDGLSTEMKVYEKRMRDTSEMILEAVGTKYGHDSEEYVKAGGTRKSDRKRPVRKPKTK